MSKKNRVNVFLTAIIRLFSKRGGETAYAQKAALKFKLGKWHIYKAKLRTKVVTLILPYKIKPQLNDLKRITDYLFIGGHR